MNFFSYVERQKGIIRGRHDGEEILISRGQARIIKEGEQMRTESFCSEEKVSHMTSEQILSAIDAMKGLNRRERERFARKAPAV